MNISKKWIEKMAKLEEGCESISVGGLAVKLGLYRAPENKNNYNSQKDNTEYNALNNN